MRSRSIFVILLFSLLVGLAGCASEGSVQSQGTPAPQPTSTPPPTVAVTPLPTLSPAKRAEHMQVFETVWQTVNETYFDPNFGGVDWQAVHAEYLPRIRTVESEEAFYITLNQMCFELGASHIAVLPPEAPAMLEPTLSSPGITGLDVRWLDDQAVITAVRSGSAADKANLRPGFILLSIDGVSMDQGEDLIELLVPPFNERKRQGQIIVAIQARLVGEPGQAVSITYLDGENEQRSVELVMAERGMEPYVDENLPPMYVEIDSRRLEGGIGYIRFDGFLPPILEKVLQAIDEMGDAPAMILDIRGNPGGFYFVRKTIASQFFDERTLLWRFMTRPGLDLGDFERVAYTDPPTKAYQGPVVVLVDVMSGSSSEEFAGAMSANRRATIVGQRTSGSDLVAATQTLFNGSLFLYPVAQTQTVDGTVLEGRGVIPDIEVTLDREALLRGIDSQLEAAIGYLEGQMLGD